MAGRSDEDALSTVFTALLWLAGRQPNKGRRGGGGDGGGRNEVKGAAYRAAASILWPGEDPAVEVVEQRLRMEVHQVLPHLAFSDRDEAIARVLLEQLDIVGKAATDTEPPWELCPPRARGTGPSRTPHELRVRLLQALELDGVDERRFRERYEDRVLHRVAAGMLEARRPAAALPHERDQGRSQVARFLPDLDEPTTASLNLLTRPTVEGVLDRLFPSADPITYRALTPGMSGSSVFVVYPHQGAVRSPCVVKIGRVEDVKAELDAWTEFVKPYVDNKHVPDLMETTIGEDVGGMAYRFVASTTLNRRLEALASADAIDEISRLITRLFRIVRAAWDGERTRKDRKIMDDDYVLTPGDLTAFESVCGRMDKPFGLPGADVELVRRLWDSGAANIPRENYVALCHGDLYGDNVLVDDDGDLRLIDFSHTKPQHYLRDYVTMEGDLVLRLLQLGVQSQTTDAHTIGRLVQLTCGEGRRGFVVHADPTAEPKATAASVAALRAIRKAAWGRMENRAGQILAYRIGLIRRLVRSSARLENRLTDRQRWAGAHLAVAHARLVANQVLQPAVIGKTPTPTTLADPCDKAATGAELGLAAKVACARRRPWPQFCLIGGLYLDVILKPIDDTKLRREEWSSLEPIRLQLGGSCLQVGRHLFEYYDVQSTLFSALGTARDALSVHADKLLGGEGWLAKKYCIPVAGVSTAVSFHLRQGSGAFSTAFTHKGALEYLDWASLAQDLLAEHSAGAVLYVAGYFRTRLHAELHDHLRRFGTDQIIVIDHGQLVPGIEPESAVSRLRDAFSQQDVDVYICTLAELKAYVNNRKRLKSKPANEHTPEYIAQLVAKAILPPVTIVRDEEWPGPSKAFLVLASARGVPELVSVEPQDGFRRAVTGLDNVFNAGFLHGLATGDPGEDLGTAMRNATREGLRLWLEATG